MPEQYATLIRTAKNGPPYRLHDMTFEDFYDLNTLKEVMGNNFSTNTKNLKVKWHEIKILKIEKQNPSSFFTKCRMKIQLLRW